MPFKVSCYRILRQSKYKVFFEYHKEVVSRIKEINVDLRKWDSVENCWVMNTRGLYELMKRYRKSNKIVFEFGGVEEKHAFIKQIKKIDEDDTRKILELKLLVQKKNLWVKLKDDLDRDFEKYRELTHKNLKEGTVLYPHQIAGTMFIDEVKSVLLALEMGLGKTINSIAYVEMNGFEKVFVITPNSLKFNFYNEVEKFTHSKAHIIVAKSSKYKNKYTIEESKYIIVNYEYFNSKDKKRVDKKFKDLNVGVIDTLIADECFTYDTLIDTDKGKIKIGDIVENKLNVNILSYNHTLKKIERKTIVSYLYNGYKDVIKVKLSNGEVIECTPDHKFYSITENKYKPIKSFVYGEKIINKKDKSPNTNNETIEINEHNRTNFTTNTLQNRHWNTINKVSNRSRCENSQNKEVEIFRQKENGDTEIIWVESVEILESGNRQKFGRGGQQNKRVYDLEIIDNHNYFANNILVSNCQALKNTASNTFKNFKRIFNKKVFRNEEISKVFLSGTPAPNRVHELYTILNQISPIDFATKKHFNEYYCGMSYDMYGFGGWSTNVQHQKLEELFHKISPYVYRKKKEEVLTDLPDKIYQKIILELNPKEDKLYNLIEEDVVNEIYSKPTSNALTIMLRLRQYTSAIKVNHIKEIIDNLLEQGEKIIIVDMFKESLYTLHDMYPEQSALHTGDQTVEDRAALVAKFQDPDSDVRIFLASIQTANYGLTLTASSKMIIITLPFSVGQYDQVADRCILRGELVLTKECGYVPIENINIGDLVYTHKGNWKRVINTTNRIERKKRFYNINYKGYFKPLRCTEDHKIYIYNKEINNYEWIEAKDLNINKHYMFLSKLNIKNYNPKFNVETYKTNAHNKLDINKNVKLNDELLYAFGRYVGDGWVGDHQVNICGHIDEYEHVLKSIKSIKKSFGIKNHSEYIRDNVITIYISSMELKYNFEKWFNSGAENKIIPDFIFHLNDEQIRIFLNGYYDADGYERKNTQQASTVSKYLEYQLVLIEGMLLNKPTLRYGEDAKCWSMEYSIDDKIKRKTLIKNIDGNVLFPISEIKQYKPKRNDERVYDLEIEDDNSFVVGLSSVHNCHRIGQKDVVNIYPIIFRDTLDEYVFDVIESKRKEIMKALDNVDYESNISESVLKDVINRLKNKYKE